jgi:hypothetical protein
MRAANRKISGRWRPMLTMLFSRLAASPPRPASTNSGGVNDEVYTQASAEFSERELAYLTSAIASINVWNRFGVAYRWTPPAR